MGEIAKMTPEEALRAYWAAACDCDPIDDDACEDGGSLNDAWEAAGLIELDSVNDDDLDDAFAYERGIEAGGSIWRLTAKGRAAWADQSADASNQGQSQ